MDQQQLPTPHTPQKQPPIFDGSLPVSPPHHGDGKSWAIALVVSAVLLLAAIGVAAWFIFKPGGSTVVNQLSGDGSASVTKVTFVAPADLPSVYSKRDENTHTTQVTHYDDPQTLCGVTTAVRPALADKAPKDAVVAAVEAAKDSGITVANSTAGTGYKIVDSDGTHTYDFSSEVFEQDVNIPGVAFNKQNTLAAYKQFGSQVASISFVCKLDSWEAKKAELETLIQTFKVKTER
jgi:hypothetical protein